MRDSPHLFDYNIGQHDFFYPAQDKYDFENHIVGFACNVSLFSDNVDFNVLMSNNQKSTLKTSSATTEVRINPVGAVIKRVVVVGHTNDKRLYRVEFYDKQNQLILKAGNDYGNTWKEFVLEDDERLLGMKSKPSYAHHNDPIFVIGKLI